MIPRRFFTSLAALAGAAALLTFAIFLAAPSHSAAAQATRARRALARADAAYAEQSYAQALPIYRELLQNPAALGRRREDVEYRVCVALGKTQQWEEAIAATERFLARHRDDLWEARGRYWLAQVFVAAPHEGWRVGERTYRGADVPRTESGDPPQRVWLYASDLERATQEAERAKLVYQALRAGGRDRWTAEEIDLNFDLARLLQVHALQRWLQRGQGRLDWGKPDDPVWKLNGSANYAAAWPAPKRIRHLYLQIEALAKGDHRAALARLAHALWLRGYLAMMEGVAWRRQPRNQAVRIPYPYQGEDAVALLRSIATDFPNDTIRDPCEFQAAQWQADEGRYAAAVAALRRFIAARGESQWAEDARHLLTEILRRQVGLEVPGSLLVGERPRLRLSARNVRQAQLRVYRVPLANYLPAAGEAVGDGPHPHLNALTGRVAQDRTALGDPVLTRAVTFPTGDHQWRQESVELPELPVGAYLLELDAEDVGQRALLLVTDLALVLRQDERQALALVVDAQTGQPVPDAAVLFEQRDYGRLITYSQLKTDHNGLARLAPLDGRTQNTAALAWKGNRFAATSDLWRPPAYRPVRDGDRRVYCYTDRPVYRPGHRVRFRALVYRSRAAGPEGDWEPVVGERFRVQVRDARGQQAPQGEVTTDEFGAAHGEFTLSAGAPLGMYYLSLEQTHPHASGPYHSVGGGQFRVEEYKKPEFEVTVTPAKEVNRVGDAASATLKATYYFGAPVPRAKVAYTVTRTVRYPYFDFYRPYAELYGPRRVWFAPGRPAYGGEAVVASGAAETNERGEAVIKFSTATHDPNLAEVDLNFRIRAEVTDASRRTIEGEGEVRAVRRQFSAFLRLENGFYEPGDFAQGEVRTIDANDRPISVAGTLRIYRQERDAEDRLHETVVHEQPLQTNAEGRARFRWQSDQSGCFRIAFEARDEWEQQVTGSILAWIAGEGAGRGVFHNRHVQLTAEKEVYRPGETARLLLAAAEPDATVLLTVEAGSTILSHRVVRLRGRSEVLELPMEAQHVPNISVVVTAVARGQLFQSGAPLFIPPAERLLDVKVTPDRSEYRPGEMARVRITARDAEGRPVRGQFSLAAVDRSVYYIQPEIAPNLRAYFYGQLRHHSIPQQGSFGHRFVSLGYDQQPPNPFRRHPWTLPDGMGRLAAWELANRWLPNTMGAFYGREHRRGLDMAAGAAGGYGGLAGPRGPAGPPTTAAAGWGLSPIPRQAELGLRADRIQAEPQAAAAGAVALRTEFADTAFWSPAVVTDASGEAVIEFPWPDNLTTWQLHARGSTATAQVGAAEAQAVTKKDLIVRLQAPRFFVERDRVVLSANVHNYRPRDETAQVSLAIEGHQLLPDLEATPGETPDPARFLNRSVRIPANDEARVDWPMRVLSPGPVTIRVTAKTSQDTDGVQLTFPVLTHGVEKLVVRSGAMLAADASPGQPAGRRTDRLTFQIPSQRRAGSSELIVRVTPSLASVMLDALPYLVDYPYGCIEQTVSRFLPSVVTQKTLADLGVDLADLKRRAEAEWRRYETGVVRPQESGYTYPEGLPGDFLPAARARDLWYWRANRDPVFNPAILRQMVLDGLSRIAQAQHGDGGWGWWIYDRSDPLMTSYVLYGLLTARDAGVTVNGQMIDRGLAFLAQEFREGDDLQLLTYLAWVLSLDPRQHERVRPVASGRLFQQRARLAPYPQALLALALQNLGRGDQARVLVDNLENTATIDPQAGTACWRRPDQFWWYWYHNEVETNAMVLKAIVAVDPHHRLAPLLVRWLVENRRGSQWHSTRETAMVVYALADYVRATRELAPDLTVEVDFAGRAKRTFRITRENALLFDNTFIVPDRLIPTGAQTVTVTRQGTGNLYYSAYLRYFTQEEGIRGEGHGIRVVRRYYRLEPAASSPPLPGQGPNARRRVPTPAAGADGYRRVPLRPGERLQSGELIEVQLLLESDNDYDYLVFEDMKPAGCEPVEVRSGYAFGTGVYSNIEYRDEKVALFVGRLPQGRRELRYRLRAEIPGVFHILPTNGYAMYAPDIRCVADEAQFGIQD